MRTFLKPKYRVPYPTKMVTSKGDIILVMVGERCVSVGNFLASLWIRIYDHSRIYQFLLFLYFLFRVQVLPIPIFLAFQTRNRNFCSIPDLCSEIYEAPKVKSSVSPDWIVKFSTEINIMPCIVILRFSLYFSSFFFNIMCFSLIWIRIHTLAWNSRMLGRFDFW
jgi:hypothetical protein